MASSGRALTREQGAQFASRSLRRAGRLRFACSTSLVLWLRHVAERLSAQDGALPERRPPVGRTRRRVEWLVGRREKSADALGVGNHREELHAALALGTLEDIYRKRSAKKFGPRSVRASSPRGLGRRISCRRVDARIDNNWLGRDARAPLAS